MKYKPIPSFDEWTKADNAVPNYTSELRSQYMTIYGLLTMKLPSCFIEGIKHSMFEVASLNKIDFKDVGFSTKFTCPFTGYGMRIHNSFFGGPPMWVPQKISIQQIMKEQK